MCYDGSCCKKMAVYTAGYKKDMVMAFISWSFYVFLAVLVIIYYILPKHLRWYVLLTGSILFYAKMADKNWGILILFLGTAIFSFLFAILIRMLAGCKREARILFGMAVVIVILPLLLNKEANFILVNWMKAEQMEMIVPLGIAFYTLQTISYLADIYRGRIDPQRNFLKYLLFISFFPQIVQGPIPRYAELSEQLYEGHDFDETDFTKSYMLILWGFFLKLVIADKAGVVVDTLFRDPQAYLGAYVWLGGFLYSIQLYTDFLACVTLAQGAAGLFGVRLTDNFNHPYFAASVREFWRRWHLSLSFWLRDYIYIPLGGNRRGKMRKYLNILITFAISGIWHGGGYKYLIWGLMHALYQIFGELLMPAKQILDRILRLKNGSRVRRTLQTISTFFFIMIAWIVFRAESLRTAVTMIKSMFTVYNPWILVNDSVFRLGLNWREYTLLMCAIVCLAVVSALQEKGVMIRDRILQYSIFVRWAIYIGVMIFIMIFGTYGYGFDPQAFIYGGF